MSSRDLDAAGILDPALRASYEECRRLNARHGRTYYLATLLLPPAKRPAVHALYGFARYADDIVDDLASTLTPAEKAHELLSFGKQFVADLGTGGSDHPVGRAMADTVLRYDIDPATVTDFLDAMAMDLTVTRYATFEDLRGYMHGSAAVIGLQMLPVLGAVPGQTEQAAVYAAELGVAFQLTNFIRDVGEDLARGRVYLPQDSVDLFGATFEVVDGPFRRLLAHEIARCRELYRSAPARRPAAGTVVPPVRRDGHHALLGHPRRGGGIRVPRARPARVRGSGHAAAGRRAGAPEGARGTGRAVRDPVEDLRAIAFGLERGLESTYKVKAYRGAANTLAALSTDEIAAAARAGTLTKLPGVGEATQAVVLQSLAGHEPDRLLASKDLGVIALDGPALALRQALTGDCHAHSDWSDGGSPIEEMARAAMAIGHDYMVLTDHSPRLTVAHGLTADRLLRQLDVVAELNETLAPFRILTGIECDINLDGSLDQTDELLGRVDVVVASVHSKLKMPGEEMTRRMVAAVANPHTDILGHCTGRMVIGRNGQGKGRPESEFDPEVVFAACAMFDVAVEVNCRPERLDPPRRLLTMAESFGVKFSLDTDAHAPGQLDWQGNGCLRAVECGVPVERVINTWAAVELLAWAAGPRGAHA